MLLTSNHRELPMLGQMAVVFDNVRSQKFLGWSPFLELTAKEIELCTSPHEAQNSGLGPEPHTSHIFFRP